MKFLINVRHGQLPGDVSLVVTPPGRESWTYGHASYHGLQSAQAVAEYVRIRSNRQHGDALPAVVEDPHGLLDPAWLGPLGPSPPPPVNPKVNGSARRGKRC